MRGSGLARSRGFAASPAAALLVAGGMFMVAIAARLLSVWATGPTLLGTCTTTTGAIEAQWL